MTVRTLCAVFWCNVFWNLKHFRWHILMSLMLNLALYVQSFGVIHVET